MSGHNTIIKAFEESGIPFRVGVPMSDLTSFGVGGPADLLVLPKNIEQIAKSLRMLAEEEIPVFAMGRGTNLLPSDSGFRGALLKPTSRECEPRKEGNFMVGPDLPLEDFITRAITDGLAGGEALMGIPGNVGGAIAMNAGAFDVRTGDLVANILAFDLEGKELELDIEKAFEYRDFAGRGKSVIAEAEFRFVSMNEPEKLLEKAEEYKRRRGETQPVGQRSAGCIFVNPEGEHAGQLIEEAGLKGTRIGGAHISRKHANFIINKGNATSSDIIELIELIRKTVNYKFGIELKPEVITPGYTI